MTSPVYCPFCGSAAAPQDTVCRVCGAALGRGGATALLTLPPTTTLHGGQYVLDRVLGQGGFGITYDARDQRLGMRVAIKELFVGGSTRRGAAVLPPLSQSAGGFEETKRAFLAEAKVLARFSHPGIVRVLNYFEENDTAYLVMEFLRGETLGEAIVRRGPLPPVVAAEVMDTVAGTLEVVHITGLLHRDIKPDNIFLEHTGRIVLIDFGSVREFDLTKTVSHTRLVTPGYAPLEQYSSAARFGPYTDIYALGATIFHALTGQMPPPATDLSLGAPLPPLLPETPANLRDAVLRAMSSRIDQRPQSAAALRQLLRGDPAAKSPAFPPRPPQPAPVPQPTPRPQPQPQPRPHPRPQPAPPPPPAPTPVPMPPPPPAPSKRELREQQRQMERQQREAQKEARRQTKEVARQQRLASKLGRNLVILLGVAGGALLGPTILDMQPDLQDLLSREMSMLLGAVLGGLLSGLLWWALPVMLPTVTALTAYSLTQNLGYSPPTVIGASVAAIVLSVLLMRLLRRI